MHEHAAGGPAPDRIGIAALAARRHLGARAVRVLVIGREAPAADEIADVHVGRWRRRRWRHRGRRLLAAAERASGAGTGAPGKRQRQTIHGERRADLRSRHTASSKATPRTGTLKHDPEKWIPVFAKDHARARSPSR